MSAKKAAPHKRLYFKTMDGLKTQSSHGYEKTRAAWKRIARKRKRRDANERSE
jgi:hypothetical protein